MRACVSRFLRVIVSVYQKTDKQEHVAISRGGLTSVDNLAVDTLPSRMASTPVTEVTVKKQRLGELRVALTQLDNPNSQQQGERPTKYKFKEQSRTRYDLAMNYATVADAFRIVEKVRGDLIRNAMDAQLKEMPDSLDLTGKWNHDAGKEIDDLWQDDVTLQIRKVELSRLDLKENNLPFVAIGVLMGTIIVDDSKKDDVEGADD